MFGYSVWTWIIFAMAFILSFPFCVLFCVMLSNSEHKRLNKVRYYNFNNKEA